jgi:hypothetical protein
VLAENLVLGAVGGVVGLLLTAALLPVLRIVLPDDFPRAHEIGMSWAGIAFALSTAILTSILAGLIAAFRQAQQNPSSGFRHEDRATSLGRQATRLRSALVIGEVALASVLSIGSVLLLRSSLQLEARSHGFDPNGVLTFRISLPRSAYQQPREISALYPELTRKWRETPGIMSAALTTNLPWDGYDENTSFDIVGRTRRPGENVQARGSFSRGDSGLLRHTSNRYNRRPADRGMGQPRVASRAGDQSGTGPPLFWRREPHRTFDQCLGRETTHRWSSR